MKYAVRLATAALLVGGMTGTVAAQNSNGGFLKSPVFLFMPGAVTVNAISAPSGTSSATGFLLRFQTTITTSTPYFTPVFGTQWTPNGVGDRNNSLTFFYGFTFPIIQPGWTNGWFAITVDPLGVFHMGGGGPRTTKPYGHDFFLEGAAVLNLGAKMIPANNPFSRLGAYFLLDQQMSNIPRGGDRFNPILLYGLVLPLAPWP